MSAGVERSGRPRLTGERERIVGFLPERVKAPFLLRCGAALIDYIFAVMIPVLSLVLGRVAGLDGARLLGSELNNAGWLAALVFGLANIILLPMLNGQTIGKALTGIRIVRLDGTQPDPRKIAIRQTAGYLFTFATLGIGFILSVFNNSGRMLHDYVSGTVVIYADKKRHQ